MPVSSEVIGQPTIPPWERVSFRSAGDIRRHPRFQEAHDCFVDEMIGLYGDNHRLIRSLLEYVRAVTFMVVVCLDAVYDPDDASSHVTMARLRNSLALMGITDGRRIADLVDGMERDGFLTRETSPSDGRAHILRPTEKMLAADREWLAVFHAPLALLYPDDAGYQAAMALNPAYQAAYRRVSLSTLSFADKIVSGNPAIGFFLSRDVGIRVLMVLMATVRGATPARTTSGFYTAAAERTGVSRTHVRNLMVAAADLGLVVLPTPSRRFLEVLPPLQEAVTRWIVLPPLQEAVTRWIADSLSGVDLVCRLAETELAGRGGRS